MSLIKNKRLLICYHDRGVSLEQEEAEQKEYNRDIKRLNRKITELQKDKIIWE